MLQALRMEWHLAWWSLPEHFRKQMHLPGFEVREMENRWGSWYGSRKLLVLNIRLIQTTTWPCMREVLRHEMAHQLADEAFHNDDTSHGPQFREACRLLNADPRASGSVPSIYQWIHDHDGATDPRVEKIRKLLALAASPHPHEAEAAMLKAHELMTRYNIEPGRKENSEYISMCIGAPALRHSTAYDAMAAILRDFYFVETIYISIIVPAAAKRGKILEISGTSVNVKMASYIADFLNMSIHEQANAKRIDRKRTLNDYALGFLKGVSEKLTGQRNAMAATSPETAALITRGDSALLVYFRKRYPRLRTRYNGGRNMDEAAYSAGIKDGRNLVIHRPVEAGTSTRGRMLGA
ncbi:MAG: DUF2786 domain-containing protein [bacterium]